MVRIAQGFLYMGKGLMTLNPIHSHGLLINPVTLGSLLILMVTMMNSKELLFTHNMHYLLYYITPAMTPRYLICIDQATNEPVSVSVRVGTAVDTTGKIGNPKQITGFQTHTTPVLLQVGEKAEMETDEWEPLTHILEGVVIVKKKEKKDGDGDVTMK